MQNGTDMQSRPRGRPRSFDPATALQSASECFRVAGFAGTSLDDLAAATGLNRPSLYAAFGDKRALYLAALDRTIANLDRAFDQIAALPLPLRDKLTQMFALTITGYWTGRERPSGCIAIGTAATAAVEDDDVRNRLAKFLAIQDRRIESMLADDGDRDAAAHARLIAAVLHSLSIRARAGADRADLDRLAADCVTLICA